MLQSEGECGMIIDFGRALLIVVGIVIVASAISAVTNATVKRISREKHERK